ncbi:MAG TPA: ABC transporter permease subunit [Arachnia sp.]|nr:ABC transporter permease subunit [Arachnia sp.]
MSFRAFLSKDLREIVRTWRIFVLPGILLFSAVTGPPTAAYTAELLATLGGDIFAGVMPDPTWVDSYAQWTKNLSQIVAFALIIMMGSVISGEKRAGTAIMVLTKPVSRAGFVLSKFVSTAILLIGATLVGMLVTWGVTLIWFPDAPFGPLLAATAAWLLFALLLVAVVLLGSAAVDSGAGAAGIGLGFFFLLMLSGIWGPMLRWTPAGMINAPVALGADVEVDLLWPALTTAALAVVLVWAAVKVFERREL